MLVTIVLALACHGAGSVALIAGMVTGSRRLQRVGSGLLILVTVWALGLAMAERQPFWPAVRSRPARVFK